MMENLDQHIHVRNLVPSTITPKDNTSQTNSVRYSETDESLSSETKSLIDQVYKKIAEMHKLIRKAEEDAQVQMLKWENYVI